MNELWDKEEPDWFANDGGDDEKDEEGGGSSNSNSSIDNLATHVLLLIDCAAGMFAPQFPDPQFPDDDERISAVQFALATVQDTIRKKIRLVTVHKSGQRDGIGVLLYNTRYRLPLPKKDDEDEADDEESVSKEKKEEGVDNDEEDDDDDDDDDFMTGVSGPRMSTVHELLPLQPPGVKAVMKLRSTQPDLFTDEIELDLAKEYRNDNDDADAADDDVDKNKGADDDEEDGPAIVPLQEALYEAQRILSDAKCVKDEDRAQIWIVTATDRPHRSASIVQLLQTAVADLRDRGLEMVVWPVLPPGDAFAAKASKRQPWDATKFFDPIGIPTEQQSEEDEEDGELPWAASVLKKTRRSYRVPLLLPNWKEKRSNSVKTEEDEQAEDGDEALKAHSAMITLDLYKLVQDMKIPRGVPIHNQTGKRLSRITEGVSESGTVLYTKSKFAPTQPNHQLIRKYFEFGGERVPFTEEDKTTIKKQCNANPDFPSLILLGFKPAASMPFYHQLKHPYLIYPNDDACRGSMDAFAHLHASMLRKNVVGIGEFLYRAGAISYLVALFPVQEFFADDGDDGEEEDGGNPSRITSAGLRMVRIPFEDEVRAIAEDDATKTFQETGVDVASEALVEAAVKLIERQNLNAEIGQDFENPAVEKYWDYIEAIALEEGKKAGRTFDTELDETAVLEHAGAEIEMFSSILPEDIAVEKKRKAKTLEPDDTGIDWVGLWREGNLSRCKNDQLKKFLGSRGEIKSGNKDQLVERISGILEAEAESKVKTEDTDRALVEEIQDI